jgi:hypothetical protein
MKILQNIVNLIVVRDNLNSILNGYGSLSKEDKINIQLKLNIFNKVILEQSLKLDVSDIEEKQIPITRGFTISSTEDTEAVMKKFMQPKVNVEGILPNSITSIVSGEPVISHNDIISTTGYKYPMQTVDETKSE